MKFRDVLIDGTCEFRLYLTECTLLCAKHGELDYGDPVAVIYPNGETVMQLDLLPLADVNDEPLARSDIDWSDDESKAAA